jgi:hypothetical protein
MLSKPAHLMNKKVLGTVTTTKYHVILRKLQHPIQCIPATDFKDATAALTSTPSTMFSSQRLQRY